MGHSWYLCMEIIHEKNFEYVGVTNGLYTFITRDCSSFDPSVKMVAKAQYRRLDGSTTYLDYIQSKMTKQDVIQRIRELA